VPGYDDALEQVLTHDAAAAAAAASVCIQTSRDVLTAQVTRVWCADS